MAVLPGVLGSRTLRRTEKVRLRSESRGAAGWLPGGTTISTISRRRLMHNAGYSSSPAERRLIGLRGLGFTLPGLWPKLRTSPPIGRSTLGRGVGPARGRRRRWATWLPFGLVRFLFKHVERLPSPSLFSPGSVKVGDAYGAGTPTTRGHSPVRLGGRAHPESFGRNRPALVPTAVHHRPGAPKSQLCL